MIKARHKFSTTLLLMAFFMLFIRLSFAQQLNPEQVKAAYLFNFLKHITWPQEDNKQQFVIAIYQDKDFYNLLSQSFNNKQVKQKNIQLIYITSITRASSADLLYIPNQFNNTLAQIATQIRGSQTLLVTDNSADKHNAMINLIDNAKNGAISFEVNKSNIIYEQLQTSAELLLLGGTELDIASLYRETEQAMQRTREREAKLNAKLAEQQAKIKVSNSKLKSLNTALAVNTQALQQQEFDIQQLKENEQKQQLALQSKEQELSLILQQLSAANKNYSEQTQAISQQQQQVAEKEQQNQQMSELIKQNRLILEKQQQNIASQQQEINVQDNELAAQQQTIVEQKNTITITFALVVIAILALLVIVRLLLKNKKTTEQLTITLSHLEETQNQLIHSEKMASLGKLIAGVAHEINTPLGIAVTSTSLIQENIEKIAKKLEDKSLSQKQLQSFIHVINESASISNKGLERVITLMHNFKEVAADQIIEEVREINLADYIAEVITTLNNEMKKSRVRYQFSGHKNICIHTTPGALAQVITNLVNNSIRHGFPADTPRDNADNCISITLEQHNNDIKLTYHDNGIGMDNKTLTQVFEPFFTTKRNKGGTGLGMNIVFNLIEQKLGGHIEIQSTLGQGMSCFITLPFK